MIPMFNEMIKLPLKTIEQSMDMLVKTMQGMQDMVSRGMGAIDDQAARSGGGASPQRAEPPQRTEPSAAGQTGSKAPDQHSVFIIAPLREPVEENARKLRPILAGMDPGIFDRIGTVHFARVLLVEDKSPGGKAPPQFAFITTYDGEFRPYVQDFADNMGDFMDEVSQYITMPDGIVPVKKHAKELGDFILATNQDLPFWYSANPHSTVMQIRADARNRS